MTGRRNDTDFIAVPMSRELMADMIAYWCRTNYPARWQKIVGFQAPRGKKRDGSERGPMIRYRVNQITEQTIRYIEMMLDRIEPELVTATKEEAQAAGSIYYYSEEPCRNGHESPRYVSNDQCVDCARHNAQRYYGSEGDSE